MVENKKEYTKKYNRQYYLKNKNKIIRINTKYNQEHKEEIKEYMKGYKGDREKRKKYMKRYYQENKEKIKKYNNKWANQQWKNNPLYRLKSNIRHRIRDALKENKTLSSIKYLSIDIQSYKKFLENQFDKNMNWDNFGFYWEIDHIIPLNTFNFSIEENKYIAFNYKNTRPLERIKNRCRPKNGSDVIH